MNSIRHPAVYVAWDRYNYVRKEVIYVPHCTRSYHVLGEFLKCRRDGIQPADIGLPAGARRRTPGLRREEVAALAGVGVDWYTQLEQGRPIHVSDDVLNGVARALQLNRHERQYVFFLAREQAAHLPEEDAASIVMPMVRRLLHSLPLAPSMVVDETWNVLAWNRAAAAAYIDFSQIPETERNFIWMVFTRKELQQRFAQWDVYGRNLVARFRYTTVHYLETSWLPAFVDRLCCASQDFSRWWQAYSVADDKNVRKVMCHPEAGRLVFDHMCLYITDNRRIRLYVNIPDSTTDTEEKISRLLHNVPARQ